MESKKKDREIGKSSGKCYKNIMLFSSPVFLFGFLPVVLVGYVLVPKRWKNLWLLVASLGYYWFGEPNFFWVMGLSIVMNYGLSRLMQKNRRWLLGIGVAANLGLLAYFKYAGFVSENISSITNFPTVMTYLPAGISFFTFHAISYLVDLYRREVKVQRNPITTALYIALFPQLIAGPILRYKDMAGQLVERKMSVEMFAQGVRRFVAGLAKKVLIANSVARTADMIFSVPGGELTMSVAWVGAIAYTLQIYFDFSGYSDMAIGLGKMFGFTFKENFNFPYVSKSVQEFWRRWHISLSTWFRDYLYIPLGGNREGKVKQFRNLLIVFGLCGLWHGANWTFVIWGLYHGTFLILERWPVWKRLLGDKFMGWIYTQIVVIVGWVIFRANMLSQAREFVLAMVRVSSLQTEVNWSKYGGIETWVAGGAGIFLALRMHRWLEEKSKTIWLVKILEPIAIAGILLICAIKLSGDTYNPFLYYRF